MNTAVTPNATLSPRETEVLIYVSKGFTNAEIARLMRISNFTVADYLKSIFKELEVCTRAEAAVWAAKKGLV